MCLEGTPVGVFTGPMSYEGDERDRMIGIVNRLWDGIGARKAEVTGLVRADLVATFDGEPSGNSIGDLRVSGAYELNGAAPECAAACAALRAGFPRLQNVCVDAPAILAEAIRDTYNGARIDMVFGKNPVRDAWGGIFLDDLKRSGLNIGRVSPEEAMRGRNEGDVLWRWGDLRINGGESHYLPYFGHWLTYHHVGEVFNTVFKPGEDPFEKDRLIGVDPDLADGRLLTGDADLEWSTELVEGSGGKVSRHSSLVLKPNQGASGNDVFFGEDFSLGQWRKIVSDRIGKGFAFWRLNWLPKITVNGIDELAIDLSPAFWAEGGALRYLYTISRVATWREYRYRKLINVAKRGGVTPFYI